MYPRELSHRYPKNCHIWSRELNFQTHHLWWSMLNLCGAYTELKWPMFWKSWPIKWCRSTVNPQKKGRRLGSRHIYIYSQYIPIACMVYLPKTATIHVGKYTVGIYIYIYIFKKPPCFCAGKTSGQHRLKARGLATPFVSWFEKLRAPRKNHPKPQGP